MPFQPLGNISIEVILMRKLCFLLSFVIAIIFSTNHTYAINENTQFNRKQLSYEEPYLKIGYKSVEEALKEFEKHFKRELK